MAAIDAEQRDGSIVRIWKDGFTGREGMWADEEFDDSWPVTYCCKDRETQKVISRIIYIKDDLDFLNLLNYWNSPDVNNGRWIYWTE